MARFITLLLLLAAATANAELEFVIKGVDDPLRANVRAYIDFLQVGRSARVSNRDLDKILENAIEDARAALRPYGYYQPEITGRYIRQRTGDAVLELSINRGPPVRVSELVLRVDGPGATQRVLRDWQNDWPLTSGKRLDQTVWKQQKQAGIDLAESIGYLEAKYETQVIELNLEENTAVARLVMSTGPRYVVGDIDFGEHVLRQQVVDNIPRFASGDPFTTRLMDGFRADLWKTGYFTDVSVTETRRPDGNPPVVDLAVKLETATKNQYLGALGFGTDTGIRLQGNWTRRPMSSRGDRLDIGVGWQETNEEFAVRGNYRVPRLTEARQYWTADLTIKFENQDLEFKRSDEDENFVKIANGNIDERQFRFGQLREFDARSGDRQLSVTPFVQFLNSDRKFDPLEPRPVVLGGGDSSALDRLLVGIDNAVSVGVDVDLISVRGKSFDARGHHERFWAFTSSSAFGSEIDFTQVYLSSRRSYVVGDNWKFLLRGELGYTEATVDKVLVDADGTTLDLSVTRLPNFYRFRAGGGASVRGYAFEQLSNNNVGSNHIATGSFEVEYRFRRNWSAAVFADIGNAFNDWEEPNLKLGVGLGIRWYSVAGPIRVDIAQARDFTGKPWRLHFTIGTPLL
ncbi:MAG: BamA/TamA family outer membrane protein [Woeseiaceae bacterium]|nr:BamA/TamA family outer membrane protein [Woeseiaceae bacterium]